MYAHLFLLGICARVAEIFEYNSHIICSREKHEISIVKIWRRRKRPSGASCRWWLSGRRGGIICAASAAASSHYYKCERGSVIELYGGEEVCQQRRQCRRRRNICSNAMIYRHHLDGRSKDAEREASVYARDRRQSNYKPRHLFWNALGEMLAFKESIAASKIHLKSSCRRKSIDECRPNAWRIAPRSKTPPKIKGVTAAAGGRLIGETAASERISPPSVAWRMCKKRMSVARNNRMEVVKRAIKERRGGVYAVMSWNIYLQSAI